MLGVLASVLAGVSSFFFFFYFFFFRSSFSRGGGAYVSMAKSVRTMMDRRMIPVMVAKMPTQKTSTTRMALAESIILEWTTQMGSAMMAMSMATPTAACVHIMMASLSLERHFPLPGGFQRSLLRRHRRVSIPRAGG